MTETLLTANDLWFRYPESECWVLQGVDLAIQAGTITVILGGNGSGKTTLLKILLGRFAPQKGGVQLAGKPLHQYSRREMGSWLGYVPQQEHVPFEYSVLEYVLLGRTPYLEPLAMPQAVDEKIALDVLQQLGMEALAERSVSRLSGGEKQLMLIARALTQKPRVLLLDEPSSHLDLANQYQILQVLHQLKEQGLTVVLTTHEPDWAVGLAEYMIFLKDGKLLYQGDMQSGLNGALLSEGYGIPLTVAQADGRQVVTWQIQPKL